MWGVTLGIDFGTGGGTVGVLWASFLVQRGYCGNHFWYRGVNCGGPVGIIFGKEGCTMGCIFGTGGGSVGVLWEAVFGTEGVYCGWHFWYRGGSVGVLWEAVFWY